MSDITTFAGRKLWLEVCPCVPPENRRRVDWFLSGVRLSVCPPIEFRLMPADELPEMIETRDKDIPMIEYAGYEPICDDQGRDVGRRRVSIRYGWDLETRTVFHTTYRTGAADSRR
jgi:hypothetical protein